VIQGNGKKIFDRILLATLPGWLVPKIASSLYVEAEIERYLLAKCYSSIRSDRMHGVVIQIESRIDIDYRTFTYSSLEN
jgi:hypothetical protein